MKKEKREGFLEKREDGSFRLLKYQRKSCCPPSDHDALIIRGDFSKIEENAPLKVEGFIGKEEGREILKEATIIPTRGEFPYISLLFLGMGAFFLIRLLKRRLPLP